MLWFCFLLFKFIYYCRFNSVYDLLSTKQLDAFIFLPSTDNSLCDIRIEYKYFSRKTLKKKKIIIIRLSITPYYLLCIPIMFRAISPVYEAVSKLNRLPRLRRVWHYQCNIIAKNVQLKNLHRAILVFVFRHQWCTENVLFEFEKKLKTVWFQDKYNSLFLYFENLVV